MDVSQCQLLEEKAGEGKAAKAARLFSDHQQHPCKERAQDQTSTGERLTHAAGLCSSPTGKVARTTASKGPS